MPQVKDISPFEKPLILNLVFNRFAAAGAVTPASSKHLFGDAGTLSTLWVDKATLGSEALLEL